MNFVFNHAGIIISLIFLGTVAVLGYKIVNEDEAFRKEKKRKQKLKKKNLTIKMNIAK